MAGWGFRHPTRYILLGLLLLSVAAIWWLAARSVDIGLPSELSNDAPVMSRPAADMARGPYLTDIAGKPRAGTYFEGRRVVAGYRGPAARYRRSCDGATMDASFAPGSDGLDLAALETWRTSSPCSIYDRLSLVQVYDQDGHYPPLTARSREQEARTDPLRASNGRLASLFGGEASYETPLAANESRFTAIIALQTMSSAQPATIWSLANEQGAQATLSVGEGLGATYRSGRASAPEVDDSWLRNASVAVRSNPTVIGWTMAPEARAFFARGAFAERRARAEPTAMTRFRLGRGGVASYGGWSGYGVILWTSTLSPGEMNTAIAQVSKAMLFSVHFDAMAIAVGDSILYGAGAETDQRGPSWFLSAAMPTVELFNLGQKGQLLANHVGTEFDRTIRPLLTTSPYGPGRTAVLWQSGTNDLGSGRTARQLLDDGAQAVRLSHHTLPGIKVARTTLLPRADSGWLASAAVPRDLLRQQVDTAWRGGASGADLVIDLSKPGVKAGNDGAPLDKTIYTMAGVPYPDALYVDRLHPSAVGYASGIWQSMADAIAHMIGDRR